MTEPSRRTAVVLTNPVAGRGRGRAATAPTLATLERLGLDVVHVSGGSREEAEAALAAAVQDGPDLIVSVGGDGTHGVALQSAIGAGVPLAIIPAGSGNDLARALGVPRGRPEDAVTLALHGEVRRLDAARVRTASADRWFATVLTAGFDSLVADRTNAMRWPRGQARYVLAIAAEYARLRPRAFHVVVDGEVVLDGPAILAAVGNTDSYGGGMRMCAGADPADGLIDVTVIDGVARPRMELPRVLPRVFNGTHTSHPAVRTFRGRRVEIACSDMTCYADGDLAGQLPATVEVVAQRLRVVLPRGVT